MPPYPSKPNTLSAEGYENIRKSSGSSFAEKRAHLLGLLGCGDSSTQAYAVHESRRKPNIRKGVAPKELLPDEGLGAAVDENVFINYTSRDFRKSAADFKKILDRCLSYYMKRETGLSTTASENLAALTFTATSIPARSDGNIWLFRNPTRDRDAFAGLVGPWLAHQLGLPSSAPAGETRLTFSFAAGHVTEVRRPSFFDVHWTQLDVWHWGGKTKPLPGTPSHLGGLEELVSAPPEIGRNNRPIIRIKMNSR